MNQDIKYITENYIESEKLCEFAGISMSVLKQLIEKKLIPNFSYQIKTCHTITSSLEDEEVVVEYKKYFPKQVIDLIKENYKLDAPEVFKQKIKDEFVKAYTTNDDKAYAYGNILNEDGSVNQEKLAAAFETEWNYYLKGIYGICTLHATGKEIANKEIAVKKIIAFIEEHKGSSLTVAKKEELIKLNAEYNVVANLFAPYQRASSSRGKYLDEILKENSLEELVKNYN